MRVRVKYNHWYPQLLGIRGIVYCPFVFISCSAQQAFDDRILHHAWIHVRQMRRDGVDVYYLWWLFEFFVYFLCYRDKNKAYCAISYEREAYRLMHRLQLPATLS